MTYSAEIRTLLAMKKLLQLLPTPSMAHYSRLHVRTYNAVCRIGHALSSNMLTLTPL